MSDSPAPIDHLVHVLGLEEPSHHDGHTFVTGESLYFPTGRVYGGQVIAQSLMAGAASVPDDRLPHSIHGYFIAPGDIHQDVLFDTETLRDGRSFSARRINATQSQGAILTAIASYQVDGQSGIDFHDPAPSDVPDPETLTSAQQLMEPYAEQSDFADYYASKSPFDIRHVTNTVMLGADKESAAADSGHQLVWMRADIPEHASTQPGTISRVLNRALLAVGCDQIMMEPVLRRSGLSFMTPGISFATIDHSMWWYGDIDVTRWHLYVQDSPVAGQGRGLCQAKVYQDGQLVAAMTQEAMIRVPKKD
ncbi:MAG: thioesterase family protein [Bifidobacteriaceae bacterium]|jgi:acyl-CoA thioesterase-2|nr:thioesterase family protein [Bifidobacteriaceae bacterium]MCI1915252.1 thioesterase family protein [Bifidobacteriaceae bacterium]